MSTRCLRAGAIAVLCALPYAAGAQSGPLPSHIDHLCTAEGQLSKEMVARFLLDTHPLTPDALKRLGIDIDQPVRPQIQTIVLKGEDACDCSPYDKRQLRNISQSFYFLSKDAGLTVPEQEQYFAPNSASDISCRNPKVIARFDTVEAANSAEPSPFRVRGKVSELYIDQLDSRFKGTSSGSLSIVKDRVADQETRSAHFVAGYEFEFGKTPRQEFAVIPFVGLDKKKVTVNGQMVSDNSTDTRIAGVTAQGVWGGPDASSFVFSLSALHSRDHIDRTRYNATELVFEPIWNGRLNDFRRFKQWWLYPRVRLMVDAIHYTGRSDIPELAARQGNARRAGGEFGFSVTSPGARLVYSYDYRKLNDWKGDSDVSLFEQKLLAALDKRGLTLLSLGYVRGHQAVARTPVKELALELAFRY